MYLLWNANRLIGRCDHIAIVLVVYHGAPHGLFYTHKDALNKDLISFIQTGVAEGEPQLQPVGAFDNVIGERV